MAYFSLEKNEIFYEISGEGPSIVFLHGFLEDHTMWSEIISHFKGFQIITVDLPCHGKSRFTGDNCSMQEMARIIDALLTSLNIDNPVVIGHSMGGYVGLELLKLRTIRLTLLHSNFWADSIEKKKDRNRVIEIVLKNHFLFIREAIPGLFYSKNIKKCESNINNLINKANLLIPDEIAAATAGMRDRKDNLELIKSENITLIQGEYDPIINTENVKNILEKIDAEDKLFIIKNVGHMSIWEDRNALINCLKTIIN